ncbi:MAG: aldo/keto reductase [Phycisphaeraceae bacterium]|nr:aldo/keto reductase [Phycisphaeraceae bacterium]
MSDRLAWGILGAGNIAKAYAMGLSKSQTGRLVAVGSRSMDKAKPFAQEFGAERAHGSYEDLLADPKVQAVYICTPHPMHPQWAIRAAEAGKHILCEKPVGLNHAQAMAMIEAAREHDVFFMEAFMYRCHPQTARLLEILRAGTIGQVQMIQATFSFRAGDNPESRLMNNKLGGGGILDVGCYCTSMSRLVAGAAWGRPFVEPTQVVSAGHIGKTHVDEYAAAVLKFQAPPGQSGEIIAQVATGVRLNQDNSVRIYGTDGSIVVPNPWIPAREGGSVKIIVNAKGQTQEVEVKSDQYLYGIEADTVAKSLPARQASPPAMTWEDTLGNMATLDRWRAAIGLVYDEEKPGAVSRPLHGRPLARRPASALKHPMKYGRLPGVDKDISRLIMGCDNQRAYSHSQALFDDWFERGGTAFDTAYGYGDGVPERLLGAWVKSRGIRKDVVILGKGAHTPHCDPVNLTRQLMESLDRLQTDHVDLYLMHRDNPDIPVGEFVDVLNEHKNAGRLRLFGGSNWTIERIAAANEYAAKHGKAGFSMLSNNLSLARMVDPPWAGCISSKDPVTLAYLEKHQLAHLAWSSQARGFFTDRSAPDKLEDQELVRCWYADDNFERKARAMELAKKKGVEVISIAAAWVLAQPFPSFALIGPRLIHETATSIPSVNVELTGHEVKWLNLEA